VTPSLHLGILEADPVDEDLAAAHGNYPAMFRTLLETAAADLAPGPVLTTSCWPVWRGALPPGPDACDAWLITGSRRSVNDDESWIRALEAFVVALHGARRPLLGVCFGHQLVARALGGAVERAAVGWGVGAHRYEVIARAPWMEPARETLALRASHQDQVTRLPEGARPYLRSDFCPLAGFTVGAHFLTIQPHPEFAAPYARALLDRRRSVLGEACWTQASASLAQPVDARVVGGWFLRFLRAACEAGQSRRLPDREGSV
jgi:GMP synthase (glutamine-hydrolysing)